MDYRRIGADLSAESTVRKILSKDLASLEQRSRCLPAMKFFELGELSSGQAAQMCGLSRVAFILEAAKLGVPVAELSDDELSGEFA